MTERKPSGVSWESWIERQIRQAQERGDFDALPGAGRPIPDLHTPRDENWWLKKKIERERIATLPPALAIRHERDETMERVTRARTEREVRALVEALNVRIRRVNATVTFGPSTSVAALDVDDVVAAWRRGHEPAARGNADGSVSPATPH
ncbi:DUF1992 domain-containing protein [Egicoccus sp. AB-alg6-2]|uniref:DnaJ family domain-containing protein n=1 Tax=Egicoccus sp. AB-alg6-2 TaxID=3242692 RepID=UPI00359EBA41